MNLANLEYSIVRSNTHQNGFCLYQGQKQKWSYSNKQRGCGCQTLPTRWLVIICILCGLTEILSHALIQRDLLIYIDNTWSVDSRYRHFNLGG